MCDTVQLVSHACSSTWLLWQRMSEKCLTIDWWAYFYTFRGLFYENDTPRGNWEVIVYIVIFFLWTCEHVNMTIYWLKYISIVDFCDELWEFWLTVNKLIFSLPNSGSVEILPAKYLFCRFLLFCYKMLFEVGCCEVVLLPWNTNLTMSIVTPRGELNRDKLLKQNNFISILIYKQLDSCC